MVEKLKKLLQTADLPVQEAEPPEAPPPLRPILSHNMRDGKIQLTDQAYVLRNFDLLTADEVAELRRTIEKRRAKQAKWTFARCNACGYVARIRGELKPNTACLYCNKANVRNGGKLKEMSQGEIEKWQQDVRKERERLAPLREQAREAAKVAQQVARAKLDAER